MTVLDNRPNAKLTIEAVHEILALKGTMNVPDIARLYRVSYVAIQHIYEGRTWRSVTGITHKPFVQQRPRLVDRAAELRRMDAAERRKLVRIARIPFQDRRLPGEGSW